MQPTQYYEYEDFVWLIHNSVDEDWNDAVKVSH